MRGLGCCVFTFHTFSVTFDDYVIGVDCGNSVSLFFDFAWLGWFFVGFEMFCNNVIFIFVVLVCYYLMNCGIYIWCGLG